jgi:HlyD family secretion protein
MIKKILHVLKKLPKFIVVHKFIGGIIIAIIIVGGYFGYKVIFKTATATSYVTATAERGTLVISVSGSGQVSSSNQVDIKPKVSGDVVGVYAKNGQEVKAGTLLVQLDVTDAQKAVRDAQISLENAQITLSKLKVNQGTSVSTIQDSIDAAENNLTQAYQNGFNAVVNAFLDLPNILDGLRGILYNSDVASPDTKMNMAAYNDLAAESLSNDIVNIMINRAVSEYADSLKKYNKNLTDYRDANRFSPSDQITSLINETLETVKTMAQLAKDEQNLLDTVVAAVSRTIPSALSVYQSNISGYIGKLNSHVSNLNSISNSVTSNQQSLESYKRSLQNTQENNPLDLISQENAVEQKEVALQDAKNALANYYIRAPFNGTVADVSVKKGDSASSGGAVAVMIAKQSIAEIPLNEVDVSKVKIGQKATFTFDAIDGLEISGTVIDIDTIGTVTQGVVNYNVKVAFDTEDNRVKLGMSISVAIITDVRQNVIMVPSSAIKSQGNQSYVQILPVSANTGTSLTNNASAVTPEQKTVEIGLSNDTSIEITSGLNEGDVVITQTINSGSSTGSSTTQSNTFRLPGVTGGGGSFRTEIR